MKRSIVLVLFIAFCLTSLGMADMIQQVWLNSDWVDDAEGVAQLHQDRRPGMVLDPAPDQENVLAESWWDEASSGLGDDYTANLWGWVTVPETGTYTWHTHGDDHHVLYVSTDDSMDNLVEVKRLDGWTNVGQWDSSGDGTSTPDQPTPFAYTKNQVLAVYGIVLQGSGGHNFGIGWIRPGASDIEYISEWVTHIAPATEIARSPNPANEATDIPPDNVVLSWTPGEFANTHDVYFGTNLDDVSNATKADPEYKTTKSLGDESYSTGPLNLGTDYFWRIDEANAPPQQATVFKGKVWKFSTESVGYPITNITATASSSAPSFAPENTVNGSGLDADDQHSIDPTDMWLSEFGGSQPTWIQYEFDKAYPLYELLVWNSNQPTELSFGVGIKDVTIEYSLDGDTWTKLDDVIFNQATADASYTANNTVDMKGVMAQFVKLTPTNNFIDNLIVQYGLSEVRFLYTPVFAREPQPQDGATDVHPDVVLSWRPGRQAATHDVYLDTDQQAVFDGTVDSTTVTESSYDAGTLELDTTYHWRIDEGNEAEIPDIWKGDLWYFTTADHIIVDNFESYNGLNPDDPQSNRIFITWKDGVGYGTEDSPPYSPGNGTGSIIGHDVSPFVEGQIVQDGKQSMPYFYNNSGSSGKANYSEVSVDTAELAVGSDWTRAGVKTLTLYFFGDPANSAGEQMYLKINGVEVLYDGASSNLTHGIWQRWDVDLESLAGVDLQNVTQIIIGFRNGGGTGVVYFDNIRLNPAAPPIPDSQAPDDSKLVAHWDFETGFNDVTGKGHDGLAFGDPAIINDPVRGQVLEVDGDDRIGVSDAPDLNFQANESLTLTTWVNLNQADPLSGWRTIMAKGRTELGGGTDYVDELYGFWVSDGNNWHVNCGGVDDSPQPADGGQWHHFAFVQDGPANEGYFYLDGEVVLTGDADSCDTTGRPLFIGAAGTDIEVSAFESFKGRIDDVRIYNYALSELEIQYLVLN